MIWTKRLVIKVLGSFYAMLFGVFILFGVPFPPVLELTQILPLLALSIPVLMLADVWFKTMDAIVEDESSR